MPVGRFTRYGVQLWAPEFGGPVDPDNEAHALVMSVFGGMSKRAYPARHPYVFKGLVFCAMCERRMQGLHAHGVAYYRCR